MHAIISSPSRWRFLWLLFPLVFALSARAAEPDLSGLYSDDGTVVESDPSLFTGEVSLHALLRLSFDQRLVRARQEEAAEVRLRREGTRLTVEVRDDEGEITWRTNWTVVDARTEQGRAFTLRIRPENSGTDEYLVLFEPLESGLLQVRLQRLESTLLGPMVRARGTYLFPRIE